MDIRFSDRIIYKNNQFLAVNKWPGISVHNHREDQKDLLTFAQAYTRRNVQLIHRIDQPVSGLVLFSRQEGAMRSLTEQMKKGTVRREYLAVVAHREADKEGVLTHHIQTNRKLNKSFAVGKEEPDAKSAETAYRLLASSDRYDLLALETTSGRHHQIRLQLAEAGWPVKGDVKYGFRRGNGDKSIHLHSWKFHFTHPVSNEPVCVTAPLPEETIWNIFTSMKIKELNGE